MSADAASACSFRPSPTPDVALRRPGVQEAKLTAVFTLVLWLGCCVVGVLGLTLSYPRPRRAAVPPFPVQAMLVNVELTRVPQAVPPAAPPVQTPALPSPSQSPSTVPDAVPLLVVAEPSPNIAFALPTEGPMQTALASEAAYEQAVAPVKTPAVSPTTRPLVFGQGEGKQPAPDYPPAAVRGGQEGTVRIRFSVGKSGRVLAAEVAVPSPWPLLNDAALRVVRQRWRFAPGALRWYEVPIQFQIRK